MTIGITANGLWGFGNGLLVGAEGEERDLCYNYGNCPIPYAGIGMLVIRRGEQYEAIGLQSDIPIAQNETIYFLMNDAGSGFHDNHGILRVVWFCQSGCTDRP